MRRTISSAQTFFVKMLVVPLCLALCGLFALVLLKSRDIHTAKRCFGFALVVGMHISCWFLARLKRVARDDQNLYVSNFIKEIVIPLSDIRTVTWSGWRNDSPVTIHLTRNTEFGNRISFLPPVRLSGFSYLNSNPLWSPS